MEQDLNDLKKIIFGDGNGNPGLKAKVAKMEWIMEQIQDEKKQRDTFFERVKLLIIGQAIGLAVHVGGSLAALFWLASQR